MASQGGGNELTELVTQMKGTIEQHFLQTIHELQGKLDTEVGRVEAWLHDVTDAINEVKPIINDAFTKCDNEVADAETTVKGELDHTVEAINAYVAHLHDSKAKTQELLGNAIQHTTDAVDKLKHADDSHTATHDQITEALAGWTGNVDQMLVTLNNHQSHILDGFHTIGDQANQHLTELGTQLQHAGEFVTEHVTGVVQSHAQHAEEFVNTQKDHLVHGVGEVVRGKIGEFIGHIR